jgi:hypothetical protein
MNTRPVQCAVAFFFSIQARLYFAGNVPVKMPLLALPSTVLLPRESSAPLLADNSPVRLPAMTEVVRREIKPCSQRLKITVLELVSARAVDIHPQSEAPERAIFDQQLYVRGAYRILRHALSVKDQIAQIQRVAFRQRSAGHWRVAKLKNVPL